MKDRQLPRSMRLAGAVETAHDIALLFERVGFVWLARLGLLAVVASNADKASWVAGRFSEPGSWSPYALGYGVELVFAIAAYWLAHRLQTGEGRLLVLVLVVALFAVVSTVVNVAYFHAHSPDTQTWNLVQAVALGFAAPAAAVAVAFLTGDISAVSQKGHEAAVELERLRLDQEHQRQMQQLAVDLANQERLAKNAEARKAKALAGSTEPKQVATPPVVGYLDTGGVQVSNGEVWTYERFLAFVQEQDLNVASKKVTGDVIAGWAGVSPRTGRNWKARYLAEALVDDQEG